MGVDPCDVRLPALFPTLGPPRFLLLAFSPTQLPHKLPRENATTLAAATFFSPVSLGLQVA